MGILMTPRLRCLLAQQYTPQWISFIKNTCIIIPGSVKLFSISKQASSKDNLCKVWFWRRFLKLHIFSLLLLNEGYTSWSFINVIYSSRMVCFICEWNLINGSGEDFWMLILVVLLIRFQHHIDSVLYKNVDISYPKFVYQTQNFVKDISISSWRSSFFRTNLNALTHRC